MGLEPHRSAESRMTICGSHTTLTAPLALDLIAKDRNRREIAAQRELVEGKERPACNREIPLAAFKP